MIATIWMVNTATGRTVLVAHVSSVTIEKNVPNMKAIAQVAHNVEFIKCVPQITLAVVNVNLDIVKEWVVIARLNYQPKQSWV